MSLPGLDSKLLLDGVLYRSVEDPVTPGRPHVRRGRQGVVFHLQAENGGEPKALKVFKPEYRLPSLASRSNELARFAHLPGLRVCRRVALVPQRDGALLTEYSDLIYAVLMPWVEGPTWMDLLTSRHIVSIEQSLLLAGTLAEALTAMEEQGVAHCDLSSSNLLLPGLSQARFPAERSPVELVDVEHLFAPGLARLQMEQERSPGYIHRAVQPNFQEPDEDRFAGAMLIAEMLGWSDKRVRGAAWGYSYFEPGELHQQGERYNVLAAALRENWGDRPAELLARAWNSDTLAECPTFSEWLASIPALPQDVVASMAQPVPVLEPLQPAAKDVKEALEDEPALSHIFNSGLAAYRRGEWAGARELLSEVVRREPAYTQGGERASSLLARSERQLSTRKRPKYRTPAVVVLFLLVLMGLAGLLSLPTEAPLHALVFGALDTPQYPRLSPALAAEISELGHMGRGWIDEVRYSPDGRWLAVASSLGVYLHDVSTMALEKTFTPPRGNARQGTGAVVTQAFSPDGQTLAEGATNGTLRIWRISDGATLRTLAGQTKRISDLAFTPDGRTLASASYDGTVHLWRVSDGTLIRRLDVEGGEVLAVAYTPDGQLLATGSADGTIRLWAASDGTVPRTLSGHEGPVLDLSFAPNGELLASASQDDTVRLWRVTDGSLLNTLEGHVGWVACVAFSPDGQLLASAGEDGPVRLWSPADGSLLRTLPGHQGLVRSLTFTPDGQTLASASWDGTVGRWHIESPSADIEALPSLSGFWGEIWSLAVSPDGQILARGDDLSVQLWSVKTRELLQTLPGSGSAVQALAFDPGGKFLASGAKDEQVRLWHMPDGAAGPVFAGHTGEIHSLAFASDGRTLASAAQDTTVRLWRVAEGGSQRVLAGHQSAVHSAAFSPDGQTLASGDESGTVRLWRISDGFPLRTLSGQEGSVMALAFSPDGQTLASASWDGTVRLWRAGTDGWNNDSFQVLTNPEGPLRSVAFSPDGQLLATGDQNWTIGLWHVADARMLRTLIGHGDLVAALTFAPDGGLLISCSGDGTMRLWGIPR